MIWGSYLRIIDIGENSYWIDEGFTIAQVDAIVSGGVPHLSSGSYEWKDALIPYLNATFFDDKTEEHVFMRFFPVMFGCGVIALGMIFALLFSRSYLLALWYGTLLSSHSLLIIWSYQVRGYSALVFWVITFFVCLILHLRHQKKKFIWYALFVVLLALLSKTIGATLFLSLAFYFGALRYKCTRGRMIIIVILIFVFIFYGILFGVDNVRLRLEGYILSHLWGGYDIIFTISIYGFIQSLYDRRMAPIHMSIGIFMLGIIGCVVFMTNIYESRYMLVLAPFILYYCLYAIKSVTSSSLFFNIVAFTILIYGMHISLLHVRPSTAQLRENIPIFQYRDAYVFAQNHGMNTNMSIVISTTPWMHHAYGVQIDYAFPWSITGRESDTTATGSGKDRYSGVPILRGVGLNTARNTIYEMRHSYDVYIFVDDLSTSRINNRYRDILKKDGTMIYDEGGIQIYHLPSRNITSPLICRWKIL